MNRINTKKIILMNMEYGNIVEIVKEKYNYTGDMDIDDIIKLIFKE